MKGRYVLAGGVVRRHDRLALVQNTWPIGTFWSLPAGRVEPGESLAETAVREIAEETGLRVAVGAFAFMLDFYNRETELHFIWTFFDCQLLGGNLGRPAADDYVTDVRWVTPSEIPGYMIWPQYRDPLLDYLKGTGKQYYVDKDAGYKERQG